MSAGVTLLSDHCIYSWKMSLRISAGRPWRLNRVSGVDYRGHRLWASEGLVDVLSNSELTGAIIGVVRLLLAPPGKIKDSSTPELNSWLKNVWTRGWISVWLEIIITRGGMTLGPEECVEKQMGGCYEKFDGSAKTQREWKQQTANEASSAMWPEDISYFVELHRVTENRRLSCIPQVHTATCSDVSKKRSKRGWSGKCKRSYSTAQIKNDHKIDWNLT